MLAIKFLLFWYLLELSFSSLKGPRAQLCTILYKVDVPKSKTTIIWTPIFEWYVVRCGSKNRHPIHMCLKEIGPCAQNMLIILGSIVNMIGRDL